MPFFPVSSSFMMIIHTPLLIALISTGGRDLRGGPVIYFPSRPSTDRPFNIENLKIILNYFVTIPKQESKALEFCVIIDMRGSTWNTVKPILKVLDENF